METESKKTTYKVEDYSAVSTPEGWIFQICEKTLPAIPPLKNPAMLMAISKDHLKRPIHRACMALGEAPDLQSHDNATKKGVRSLGGNGFAHFMEFQVWTPENKGMEEILRMLIVEQEFTDPENPDATEELFRDN